MNGTECSNENLDANEDKKLFAEDKSMESLTEDGEPLSEKNEFFKNNSSVIDEKNQPSIDLTIPEAQIEYSFGTFFNWFMPSCMDIWNSDDFLSSTNNAKSTSETIIAYGARSFLFLLNVCQTKNETTEPSSLGENETNYTIRYRDLVNVFGHKMKKKNEDVFRSQNSYVTTVVFEKSQSVNSKHISNSIFEKNSNGPKIFVGNSDGSVVLYDIYHRQSILQDLPFSNYKSQCCRKISQPKILSAAWLHFRSLGSVVFYTMDIHLVRWEVSQNSVSIQHEQDQDCGQTGRLIGQVQISCLASMPAEATSCQTEPKLAVGYMGGKIAIFGFDHITGIQKSIILITDNSHNDDICSLAFSSYSIGSLASYRAGLLCSVSRDSVLKVWSCSNQAEICEFRISNQFNRSHGDSLSMNSNSKMSGLSEGQSKCNWFAAAFLPRSTINQQNKQASWGTSAQTKACSYELLVTAPNGELVTITIPDKELNSKIRISKASKFASRQTVFGNLTGLHPFDHSHQSVIFSIMVNPKLAFAVTYSLDYKMLFWDLKNRTVKAVFHLFSNGTLSIDSCLKDKRIAVAFGNSIYVMNFGGNSQNLQIAQNIRCAVAPKNRKFYQVSWNNLSDSERLGAILIGNSHGEVSHYNLSDKSCLLKFGNKANQKVVDSSKIYKFVWPFNISISAEAEQTSQFRTTVLSLHASGTILLNYLPSKHFTNKPAENFMTSKLVSRLPPENQLRKHTSIAEFSRGKIIAIGNDDGTVDILKALDLNEKEHRDQMYFHLFRFRAFTTPIISSEICGCSETMSLWLAMTALNDNTISCYHLDKKALMCEENDTQTFKDLKSTHFVVRQMTNRFRLTGHQDRVSATAWSPFMNEVFESSSIQNGRLLVSASYDTTCIVWDVPSQQPLKRFFGHRSLIYTICWSQFNPDLIFSGGEDCFHCWNWTKQPDYCSKIKLGLSIHLDSLKKMHSSVNLSPASTELVDDESLKSTSSKKRSLNSLRKLESSPITISQAISVTAKPLFALSNQIEHNSSKYDILDDIKWIFKLNEYYNNNGSTTAIPIEIIPERKLTRILLYGSRIEVLKFLQLESHNHKKHNQNDASDMILMFANVRETIERAVECGDADLILASLAINFSRDLYKQCVRTHLNISQSSSIGKLPLSKSQRLFAAYGKEMSALYQLYCMSDFETAIESLLLNSLYREAIILARIHCASNAFVNGLWRQWCQYRLSQGNYEGAIKCLVACGDYCDAIQRLEQRKTLCANTNATTVTKQFEDTIELLKSEEIYTGCTQDCAK